MAHKVLINLPAKIVMHSDVTFEIAENGRKIGTLGLSKGGVSWWPKNKQKSKDLTWKQFAKLFDGS